MYSILIGGILGIISGTYLQVSLFIVLIRILNA